MHPFHPFLFPLKMMISAKGLLLSHITGHPAAGKLFYGEAELNKVPEPEPDPEFGGGGPELPAGIPEIEESAFEGDRSIFTADIPAGCRRIGKWAFRNCTTLRKIRIPDGCEVDGEAFKGCGRVYLFGPPPGTAYGWFSVQSFFDRTAFDEALICQQSQFASFLYMCYYSYGSHLIYNPSFSMKQIIFYPESVHE